MTITLTQRMGVKSCTSEAFQSTPQHPSFSPSVSSGCAYGSVATAQLQESARRQLPIMAVNNVSAKSAEKTVCSAQNPTEARNVATNPERERMVAHVCV